MKRRWTAVILALFGGAFGLHRFYLRQPEIGVVYIFLMILNFTRFPLSAILGWYDAYRYLMMNENEFDRKYNSQNFRDRYGNRRTEPRVQETRRGKYILMDEDNVTTQGRTGYFDLIKSKKQSESYKQTGIKKFKDYDIKGSIEDFKKALELNSQDKALHFNLACAYSMEEEATKALIHLDHAVAYGFQEFDRILSHESLAYIRVFPEFEAFKNNQYRLTSSIVQSLEQRIKVEKELELEKLKSEKNYLKSRTKIIYMIAKNLIAKNIKAVNKNADIKDILEEMERHHIYHLPLVEKNKVIGIISEEKIKDLNLHREDLPKYIEEVRPVNEKEYFFQIWSQMISNQLSCIPVIDDNENYIGSITQEELVNYYTSSFNYTEPGSIIILSTKKQKYSLAKIAQIVEEEHCVVLSSFLTEKFNEEDVLITIKVNCMDIESILNSFYRFEIDVEVVFTDKEYSDIMKERYHGLMNYLNV